MLVFFCILPVSEAIVLASIVFNHHPRPAENALFVKHVLDGPLLHPGRGQRSVPFAVRMISILDDDSSKGLDLFQINIVAQVGLWMNEVMIGLQ